jgi:hypothetical protein
MGGQLSQHGDGERLSLRPESGERLRRVGLVGCERSPDIRRGLNPRGALQIFLALLTDPWVEISNTRTFFTATTS